MKRIDGLQFVFDSPLIKSWFPGHMQKATNDIKARLKNCDVVLEIRDPRIPISSCNPLLETTIGKKPRILIFNKADLISQNFHQKVKQYFEAKGQRQVLFTSANRGKNISHIIPMVSETIKKSSFDKSIYMLVIGIPNIGKSTVINSLRNAYLKKGGGAKTGKLPGVTRHVSGFTVSENPHTFLYDSPGVMLPRFGDKGNGSQIGSHRCNQRNNC